MKPADSNVDDELTKIIASLLSPPQTTSKTLPTQSADIDALLKEIFTKPQPQNQLNLDEVVVLTGEIPPPPPEEGPPLYIKNKPELKGKEEFVAPKMEKESEKPLKLTFEHTSEVKGGMKAGMRKVRVFLFTKLLCRGKTAFEVLKERGDKLSPSNRYALAKQAIRDEVKKGVLNPDESGIKGICDGVMKEMRSINPKTGMDSLLNDEYIGRKVMEAVRDRWERGPHLKLTSPGDFALLRDFCIQIAYRGGNIDDQSTNAIFHWVLRNIVIQIHKGDPTRQVALNLFKSIANVVREDQAAKHFFSRCLDDEIVNLAKEGYSDHNVVKEHNEQGEKVFVPIFSRETPGETVNYAVKVELKGTVREDVLNMIHYLRKEPPEFFTVKKEDEIFAGKSEEVGTRLEGIIRTYHNERRGKVDDKAIEAFAVRVIGRYAQLYVQHHPETTATFLLKELYERFPERMDVIIKNQTQIEEWIKSPDSKFLDFRKVAAASGKIANSNLDTLNNYFAGMVKNYFKLGMDKNEGRNIEKLFGAFGHEFEKTFDVKLLEDEKYMRGWIGIFIEVYAKQPGANREGLRALVNREFPSEAAKLLNDPSIRQQVNRLLPANK